jgi:uncharacterized cupin superfamily protein
MTHPVEDARVLPVDRAPNWAAERFGFAEDELDMRILRGALGCEHVGVSYLRFAPKWRLTIGHRHAAGEEIYVLVSGSARIKIDDEIFAMEAPAAVRVRADEFRAIRASGAEAAIFVVAGWPIDGPDGTEFAFDFWPKEG